MAEKRNEGLLVRAEPLEWAEESPRGEGRACIR